MSIVLNRAPLLGTLAILLGSWLPAQDGRDRFYEAPYRRAYLLEGCGVVSFPVTCEQAETQKFFDQGVAQLHGGWPYEAERSFRQVAALEPSCALAYWGMAMANPDDADRAAPFIEEAVVRRANATAKARMWIDALARFYEVTAVSAKAGVAKRQKNRNSPEFYPYSWPERDLQRSARERHQELLAAFERLVEAHPDDIEAKAFLARQHQNVWRFAARVGEKEKAVVDKLLDAVFRASVWHPAHNYKLHLQDRGDALGALPSALVAARTAPAVAYQWYQSGQVFAALHRHEEAGWQFEAAVRVHHARMQRDRLLPHEVQRYGASGDRLCRSLGHQGRVEEALAFARYMVALPRHPETNRVGLAMSIAGRGVARLVETCRDYHLLDRLVSLHERGLITAGSSEYTKLRIAGDLAAAFFMFGDVDRGTKQLAIVFASRQPGNDRRDELRALLALAEGRMADCRRLLTKVSMPKKYLAECWLRAGDARRARQVIESAAEAHPDRVEVMLRQIEILHACGDAKRAREVFDRLRVIGGRSDLDGPAINALKGIAEEFGYPADWRTPRSLPVRGMVQRPQFEQLGPARWEPSGSRDWKLPGADGSTVALADYRGRPVLIIFYLGFGCLHCIEQLQTFHPITAQYEKAGIDILAIGLDTIEGIQKSLADSSPGDRFRFRLLSDRKLRVFREWLTFDDFEQMPLHGTFLIDKDGRVRWQDVSFEPFNRPRWLLRESKRLLRR